MPSIIDSLVLVLNIDTKQFSEGQRKALDDLRKFEEGTENQGKRVESQTRRTSESLSNFKREAVGALAVFLGGKGIKEFIGYITTLDASTGRLSQTLNMGVADVSAWQGAVKQMGGSAEDANSALSGMTAEIYKFQGTGQSGMLGVLGPLGVSLLDDSKKFKSAAQIWLEVIDAVQNKSGPEKAFWISQLPGGNQAMVNAAVKGRAAFEVLLRNARDAGTATKESAAEAERYQASLARLDQSATNLGRSLVTNLTPALVAAMDAMKKFIQGPSKEATGKFKTDYAPIAEKHGFDPNADSFWEQLASRAMGLPTKSGKQYKWGDPYVSQGSKAAGASSFDEAGFITPPAARTALPVKPGAGTFSPGTQRLSELLSGVPGINRVTAANDGYHALLGGGHSAGRAIDVSIKDPSQSADVVSQIRGLLAQNGIDATVLDEYRNPSKNATAGHIHIGLRRGAIGAPAAAMAASGGVPFGGAGAGGSPTITTTIGAVNVNAPQARDADSIAQHAVPAFMDRVNRAAAAIAGQE